MPIVIEVGEVPAIPVTVFAAGRRPPEHACDHTARLCRRRRAHRLPRAPWRRAVALRARRRQERSRSGDAGGPRVRLDTEGRITRVTAINAKWLLARDGELRCVGQRPGCGQAVAGSSPLAHPQRSGCKAGAFLPGWAHGDRRRGMAKASIRRRDGAHPRPRHLPQARGLVAARSDRTRTDAGTAAGPGSRAPGAEPGVLRRDQPASAARLKRQGRCRGRTPSCVPTVRREMRVSA